jgi:Putative redox-active protein (C_GCAxxG_C_C)
MSDTHVPDGQLSRRKFLTGAGAMLGLAVVPALANPAVATAAPTHELPWAYTAQDAEVLGRRAYEAYYQQGGCAEATWWPLVEALAADATNADQALWGSLPKKMFAFGGGGVNSWGTVCGTLNGSSAIIRMFGPSDANLAKLIDANMQYYGETPLPTNGIDIAVRNGWTPAVGVAAPIENAPTCTSHTQLCHASISQWTMMTGYADGGTQQRDRCAKACYDLMKHTVEMLNAWKASGTVPTVVLDPTVGTCATACHKAASTIAQKSKMACDSCHDETPTHSTK